MRSLLVVILVSLAALVPWQAASAQDDFNVCHVSSSYDVTLTSDGGLMFDRTGPAPRRVEIHDGRLLADGRSVTLNAADQGRLHAFQQTARALVPKVRAIAIDGVGLAADAVREQARESSPQMAASGELDAKLNAMTADFDARIKRSNSSHDWHGPAFQQYINRNVSTLVPLLASNLLQQAVQVALSGDLSRAAALRNSAANLATRLRKRVRDKLQVLKPRVRALCPSVQKMDRLENQLDARMPDGSRLNLLDIGQ